MDPTPTQGRGILVSKHATRILAPGLIQPGKFLCQQLRFSFYIGEINLPLELERLLKKQASIPAFSNVECILSEASSLSVEADRQTTG